MEQQKRIKDFQAYKFVEGLSYRGYDPIDEVNLNAKDTKKSQRAQRILFATFAISSAIFAFKK